MEKDFINCMLFVTFVIICIYIIIKLIFTTNNLPFHIKRSIKVDLDDEEVIPEDLSFNGIPATIYQSYDNNTKVTGKLINIINNNVSNNEEFEFYLMNNNDSRLFIEQNFEPELLNVYDSLSSIDKNNLWKYCILYMNGGIYMDINLELKEELIDIITPMLSASNTNVIFTKNNEYISNKLIIASPKLPIFKELINSYLNNNIVPLTHLISKYMYYNNVKLYVDEGNIKIGNTDEICIYIK